MSISFDTLGTALSTASVSSNELESKIKNMSDTSVQSAQDEELMEACKEFEAYFIEMVFKEMKKTVPKSEMQDQATAQLTDYFKESMMSEYASQLADEGSLGLAQTLFEQMKVNLGEQIPAASVKSED